MMGSLSGGLATMGSAIPYAIAAKEAHPQRAVVALVGDGAMQMNGINGLITMARRWREWHDPRLVVMVLNNRDLNFVTWEQRINEASRATRRRRRCPTSRTRRTPRCWACAACAWTGPTRSARPGTWRSRRTGRR
jgi:thiamine pyrophosphate-dependent acetolactate synthase large subunit-like protein